MTEGVFCLVFSGGRGIYVYFSSGSWCILFFQGDGVGQERKDARVHVVEECRHRVAGDKEGYGWGGGEARDPFRHRMFSLLFSFPKLMPLHRSLSTYPAEKYHRNMSPRTMLRHLEGPKGEGEVGGGWRFSPPLHSPK